MQVNQRKFTRYFVKKEFQLDLVFRFWALLIVSAILAMGALFFIIKNFSASQFLFFKFLSGLNDLHSRNLLAIALISIILITSISVIIIIYYAYRIAGPLFNIERKVKEIGETGDLTRKIRLRSEDDGQVKDLAKNINKALENIESLIYRIKVRADQMDDELVRLKESNSLEEAKSSAEQIQSLKKDLDSAIQAFKIQVN
ncbi:MAG: hypothetical protein HQL24_10230 [Candidatus Omnitrophica bacterium]|nr:hypothetical protein [Candidatus Omnitrophota bacterium]